MTKIIIREELIPHCPIRNILSRISDKWTLLVIFSLEQAEEPLRFNRLQREIPEISQKMLTTTLRTLEDDGMVIRKIYPEVPPRVEYSLTKRAQSLLPHIDSLIEWAKENMEDILKDREKSARKRS